HCRSHDLQRRTRREPMLRAGCQHLHAKTGRLWQTHRRSRPHKRLLVRHRAVAGRVTMAATLSLLVIDDSADDRVLYRRVLKEAFGERLSFAEEASGDSGLRTIEKAQPVCVLLDYSLP